MSTHIIPRCKQCGESLPHYQYHAQRDSRSEYGYHGDGEFCSLRCGYRYGLRAVRQQNQINAEALARGGIDHVR